MALKIRRTGASDYGKFIKALVFGQPGAGKTLISSTFPNPLYASAEGGLMSIADRDIPYVDIRSSEDLLAIKNSVDQEPDVRAEILGFPVDTIVIDTIDEIQKILIAERLKATRNSAMQLQDWGWLSEQMRAMVRGFRNIPIHVVFTCHLKEVTDGETGRVSYKPGLQGGISDDIAGYVDLSLLIDTALVNETVKGKLVKVEKRTLLTTQTVKYPFLKDRSGKLPAEMEVNFTDDFERINQTIFGNVNLAEGVTYDVETPQPVLTDEPAPEPEVVAEKPKPAVPVTEITPEPVKLAEAPVAEPAPEEDTPSEGGVKVRNKLPAGVVPQPKGHGTDIYCTMCGGEVETEKRAEFSRIRHRKILDDACYESETNKKTK